MHSLKFPSGPCSRQFGKNLYTVYTGAYPYLPGAMRSRRHAFRPVVLLVTTLRACLPVPVVVAGWSLPVLAAPRTLTFVQGTASYSNRDIFNAWIGKTDKIGGTVVFDDQSGELLKGEVQVDLASIDSGNGVRDARMRSELLQTDQFPMATYTIERIEGFPKFSEWKLWGLKQTGHLYGQLTIHGVTRPVTLDATAVYLGNELRVTAKGQVKMSDYKVTPPSFLLVTVEDTVGLQVQAVAKPAGQGGG